MQQYQIYSSISKSSTNYPSNRKIHHVHNLLGIILLIVLLRMFILQSLFLTLPLLFKIYQQNQLFSIVLIHMFILQSLLLTLSLLLKIHQLNKLFSIILLHMFILQSLLLTLSLLFKIHQMLQRSRMPLWTKLAKILRP
jgi:hypothetical protein